MTNITRAEAIAALRDASPATSPGSCGSGYTTSDCSITSFSGQLSAQITINGVAAEYAQIIGAKILATAPSNVFCCGFAQNDTALALPFTIYAAGAADLPSGTAVTVTVYLLDNFNEICIVTTQQFTTD
jgi:hypothetical protein